MSTIVVSAYPADFRRATPDVVMVTQKMGAPPIARRAGQCRNVAEARTLLDLVVSEAKSTGQGFVALARVTEGRKPAGFDKARLRVEHDPEAATR